MRTFCRIEKDRIKILTEHSLSFTLIEPTETGLKKSIMDATAPVRLFFKNKNIHDYQEQKQGQEHKHTLTVYIVQPEKLVESTASFYRPNTKNGDPRIWFSGLREFAKPNDILGIISIDNNIFVLNITHLDVVALIRGDISNPFSEIVKNNFYSENIIAEELLNKLKIIAQKGFIPSTVAADTSIGRLLEAELGVAINSSTKPDYKGIELKSFRERKANRKNLFAQVPDWNLSKFKSSKEILNYFGYQRGDDFKLYCTVSAINRNSQGLMFNIYDELNQLVENSDKSSIGDFAVWSLEKLHKRLLEKHNETFWIAGASKHINGIEHFQYTTAEHTKKPIVSQFDVLLQQGDITMDHLIKKQSSGKVVEKGPLFKIKPSSIGLLFPPSKTYDLLSK